jgi:hypothetical protein
MKVSEVRYTYPHTNKFKGIVVYSLGKITYSVPQQYIIMIILSIVGLKNRTVLSTSEGSKFKITIEVSDRNLHGCWYSIRSWKQVVQFTGLQRSSDHRIQKSTE